MRDKLLWLWLALACGPANGSFAAVNVAFPHPGAVYEASAEEIVSVLGNCAAVGRLQQKDLKEARRIFELCKRHGITILTYDDPAYPASVKAAKHPPAVLYVCGEGPLSLLSGPCVGVVGTREPTPYGVRATFDHASAWAMAGLTVVSGMALGIDGVAHGAALAAKGKTVAVLGCGVAVVYPAAHRKLYRHILQNGLVLSEYPPGTGPKPYHFPARNRIVSALSSVVAVMEGKRRSGALITASFAKEQGKPVYALPGRAGDPYAEAPNLLLSEGARLLLDASVLLSDMGLAPSGAATSAFSSDILDHYGVSAGKAPSASAPRKKRRAQKKAAPSEPVAQPKEAFEAAAKAFGLDEKALSLYRMLPEDGTSCLPDELALNFDTKELLQALTMLEIAHLIIRFPSGRVCRASADTVGLVHI